MIVAVILEMLTLSSGTTPAATQAQVPDQAPQAFSESLLAASNVTRESGAANDSKSRTAPSQRFAHEDTKAPGSSSGSRVVPSSVSPQQMGLSRQVFRAQQVRSANPSVTSKRLSLTDLVSFSDVSSTVGGQRRLEFAAPTQAGIESTTAQPKVLHLEIAESTQVQRGAGPLQAGSTLPSAKAKGIRTPIAAPSKDQNNASNAVVKLTGNSVSDAQPSTVPNAHSNEVLSAVQSAAPVTFSSAVENSTPKSALSAQPMSVPDAHSSEVFSAVQSAAPVTFSSAVEPSAPKLALSAQPMAALNTPSNELSSAVQSTTPDAASNQVEISASKSVLSTQPSAVPSAPSKAAPYEIQSTMPDTAPIQVQNPLADPFLSTQSSTFPSVLSDATPTHFRSVAPRSTPIESKRSGLKTARIAQPNAAPSFSIDAVTNSLRSGASNIVASDAQGLLTKMVGNESSSSVRNSPSNDDSAPVQVPVVVESAFTTVDIVSTSSPVSTDRAAQPVAVPDGTIFATGPSIPGSTADQFIALIQMSGGLPFTGQAGVSSLNRAAEAKLSSASGTFGKDGIKDVSSGATGMKEHAPFVSEGAGSTGVSQGATSSGDQNHNGPFLQSQSATPAQMVLGNHPVATFAHTQNAANASPVQIAQTLAGAAGPGSKTLDNAGSASTSLPLALPVVNTAKLIQTMGQSEMRVGMRTNEFGNITISTSASRDFISAQISLDHRELAAVLAAHLPEMQARLAGGQAMDVRIDMIRDGIGQGSGTSGGMSNSSAHQSREDRREPSDSVSSHVGNSFAERKFSPVAAAMATADGRLNARIDIRV